MQDEKALNIDTVKDVAVATFTSNWVGATGNHADLQRLTEQLTAASQNNGVAKLLIDMNTVKILSSMAIGMLIGIMRNTEAAQKEMVLCGVQPELRRVFQAANLEKLFTFQDDRETALRAFGA